VKQLPDIGQQLGKTDAELAALVRSAKAKLDAQDAVGIDEGATLSIRVEARTEV